MMKFKLSLVMLLFLVIPSAVAIGVVPASQELAFEPNLATEVTFMIRNTQDYDVVAKVTLEDEAANHISILERNTVSLGPKDHEYVTLRIKLPATMPPGDNKLFFKVAEVPQGEGLSATTAVRSYIRVKVPYPGEYLIATIAAEDAKAGEKVPIVVDIRNDGTDTVEISKGVVSVIGNGVVDLIPITFENLASRASTTQTVEWLSTTAGVGEYVAQVVVDYEGGSTSASTPFRVGDVLINILDVVAEEVPQGWRSRVDVTIDSKWNEPIENVYAEVEIEDQIVKSQSLTIDAWSKAVLNSYVETDQFDIGSHSGTVTVFYADKTVTQDFILTISQPVNLYMVIGSVVAVSAGVFAIAFYLMRRKYVARR
jgi:hypothetical protein